MKEHHIVVNKTARYYTLGTLNDKTKKVWFIFHGYGQLADFFINHFRVLEDEHTYIVAPEALSKFYLNGFNGRVGATWMTKEDRETEIADYINYLNQLYKTLGLGKNIELNVLGFSQGVATAYRWITSIQEATLTKLILWAGILPPDMDIEPGKQLDIIKNTQTYFIYGKNDPFYKEEHRDKINEFLKIKPDMQIISFDGEHEINQEVLKEIR
ncbi:MAG: alpha/beta hydrolase [Cytophagaceae bacterium]